MNCSGSRCLLVVSCLVAAVGSAAQGAVLTHKSFTIVGTGGGGGSGSATSGMYMSDGTVWSGGGAVGLQGSACFNPFAQPLAANVTFKYYVGSTVDSLNATYGAGNWTIDNASLSFQYTIYANNTRFGGGAGNFEIYWVGNDGWSGSTNKPPYTTAAEGLTTWSGSQALLGSRYFSWSTATYSGTTAVPPAEWTTDKTGDRQGTISYSLDPASGFVADITSASNSANANVSLYLMATSDTLGMTIFTGGASTLPTLSFDVVSVPESAMALVGAAGLLLARRRRRLDYPL